MRLRFWFRRKLKKKSWVKRLSGDQRRKLARNLRDLTESKNSLDRRLTETAPRP